MLLTTNVRVKWQPNKTKQHYINKGYFFTFYGDEFDVPLSDLPKSSNVKIQVLCDYCNTEITKQYDKFKRSRDSSPIKKDACKNCHPLKTKEGNILLYGVEHYMQKPEESEKIASKKRLTYEFIKEEFKKRGLVLLTLTYKNAFQLLDYTCCKHPEKGVMRGSWSNIRNQVGCRYCGHEEGAIKQRKNYEEIKEEIESKGFTLLTLKEENINTKSVIKYYCNKHPNTILENSFDGIRYVQGCRDCYIERNKGENNHNWKGGITTLKDFLRSQIKQWREESMKFWNYKCVISGDKAEVIHHLHSFSHLMDVVFSRLKLNIRPFNTDYTVEEQNLLSAMIKEVHYEYGYGVALTREIHQLFHKIYGLENITPLQFEKFKKLFEKYRGER